MQIVDEGMGEVCHSKASASYLKIELGKKRHHFRKPGLLGRTLPLCMYATSRPDLAFYHNKKYVYEGTLLGCSGLVTETQISPEASLPEASSPEANPYFLSGEDKLSDDVGERQAIAAMLLLAT